MPFGPGAANNEDPRKSAKKRILSAVGKRVTKKIRRLPLLCDLAILFILFGALVGMVMEDSPSLLFATFFSKVHKFITTAVKFKNIASKKQSSSDWSRAPPGSPLEHTYYCYYYYDDYYHYYDYYNYYNYYNYYHYYDYYKYYGYYDYYKYYDYYDYNKYYDYYDYYDNTTTTTTGKLAMLALHMPWYTTFVQMPDHTWRAGKSMRRSQRSPSSSTYSARRLGWSWRIALHCYLQHFQQGL